MRVKNYNKPLTVEITVENKVFMREETHEHTLEHALAFALYSPARVGELTQKALNEQCSLIEILAIYTPSHLFYAQLAKRTGAAFALFPETSLRFNAQDWRSSVASGMISLDNGQIWHAPEGKQLPYFLAQCAKDKAFAARFILCPPAVFKRHLRLLSRRAWTFEAINAVAVKYPRLSAMNRAQMRFGAVAIFLSVLTLMSLFALGGVAAQIAGGTLSFFFLGWLIFRVLASFFKFRPPLPEGRPRYLPPYTVVLALYKEAKVLPRLITALEQLDYPRSRLDIKLVLENDDDETRQALKTIQTDIAFDVIIAPPEGPRTKPKALMLALPYAKGKFCVVYDAEDRPHPQQLLESVAQFQEASPKMAVLQAPLIIRNHGKNSLTALFAAEYAALFDLTLPLLAHFNLPLPLGGTSNHFKTAILRDVGGWDAFNVTEDADLGLRLARLGFQAGTLRLGTSEEAPTKPFAWLKQRSRWFKGWLQTMIVHGATPRDLLQRLGIIKSFVFFLMIGSTFFSSLLHPIAYFLLIAYHFNWLVGERDLLVMLISSGYSLAIFLLWQGARLGQRPSPGWRLVFLPLYWLMLSAAAWLALLELWRRPFHWAKTTHEGD
jgi:glycosyltransferase XagB